MKELRVLVVDGDVQHLQVVARSLRAFGIEVETTESSLGVSGMARRLEPDVVLLDVDTPAMPPEALLQLARRQAPTATRFVLFSSEDEASLRKKAAASGADGYITKGSEAGALVSYLRRVSQP
jgi:two-component system, OmpR family, response regulator